ncbi:ABC transporter permease [Oleiagrimonas soli]|uniref:ABC transporter permease n=1 Tax=Oleiagrimonas soli TaxID=1543381 RepID=A0A099CUZ6_9GAMM|nr:ABC transporter permease [Oleiagrimonas soli]KGI77778.1 hypothetical protein LF63_0104945 [Oleiagrimonas soli]MBB6183898.1 hypothetical protein [Oleiagrimonas soli]
MNALLRALHAETLKLRHTLALWMVLLAPLAIALLMVLEILTVQARGGHATGKASDPVQAWYNLGRALFSLWTLLMLPLFVTLQAALLAGLEHGNRQWKHLLAMPTPRVVHYLAKLLILAGMVIAAELILLALTPLAGWLLALLSPDAGMHGMPHLGRLLPPVAASLAASALMVAIQGWVALRWRSFTVAVAVGIVATIAGFIIGQSARFGTWFPWTLPIQAFAGTGQHATLAALLGVGGGLMFTALALLDLLLLDSD